MLCEGYMVEYVSEKPDFFIFFEDYSGLQDAVSCFNISRQSLIKIS